MNTTSQQDLNATFLVYVDDTHNEITWDGPWILTEHMFLDNGNSGAPFQNSLHGLTGNGSFTFSFNGTQLEVMGVNQGKLMGQSWECLIDDVSIQTWETPQDRRNNYPMCASGMLPDGRHTLKLVVLNEGEPDSTFWVDAIRYAPAQTNAGLPMTSGFFSSDSPEKLVALDYANSAFIQYSSLNEWSNWHSEIEAGMMTQQEGAFVDVSFYGTSFTWLGGLAANITPIVPATATCAEVDGIDSASPEFVFQVPFSPVNVEQSNQVLFHSGALRPGYHQFRITYHGNETTAPLILSKMLTDWQFEEPPPAVPGSNLNLAQVAGIVAGLIGGLVFLVVAITGLWLVFQKRSEYFRKWITAGSESLAACVPVHPPNASASPSTPRYGIRPYVWSGSSSLQFMKSKAPMGINDSGSSAKDSDPLIDSEGQQHT